MAPLRPSSGSGLVTICCPQSVLKSHGILNLAGLTDSFGICPRLRVRLAPTPQSKLRPSGGLRQQGGCCPPPNYEHRIMSYWKSRRGAGGPFKGTYFPLLEAPCFKTHICKAPGVASFCRLSRSKSQPSQGLPTPPRAASSDRTPRGAILHSPPAPPPASPPKQMLRTRPWLRLENSLPTRYFLGSYFPSPPLCGHTFRESHMDARNLKITVTK